MHELTKLKYIHLGVNSRVMWYVEQKCINKHLYGQTEQEVANDWPYCCVIADGNKMYYVLQLLTHDCINWWVHTSVMDQPQLRSITITVTIDSDSRRPIFRLDIASKWRRQQFNRLRCRQLPLDEAYSALDVSC